jgi:hypothetical protein
MIRELLLSGAATLAIAGHAKADMIWLNAPPWTVWQSELPSRAGICIAKFTASSATFGLSHTRAGLQFHVTIEGAEWPPAVVLFARVDDGHPWVATAHASADGRGITALADDATDLIEQLIGGENLKIITPSGSHTFTLTGTRNALAALAACIARIVDSPTAVPPIREPSMRGRPQEASRPNVRCVIGAARLSRCRRRGLFRTHRHRASCM